MKKIIILLFFPYLLLAQDGAFRYFISFSDKSSSTISINNPEEFLSAKTIFKRKRFSIPIDSTDLPVSSVYIDSLRHSGFIVEHQSKWFNGVIVSTYDSLLVLSLEYTFIDTIVSFGSWQNDKNINKKWELNYDISDYGLAFNQLEMIGGDKMHLKGFKGKGMIIAVIDAGFYKVDELDVFNDFDDQILSTYDFVDRNSNVYDDHIHGMMVLSTMGAKGEMMGTAPDAQYLLLRSEDVFSENLIEEFLWVCAAEYADSAGADIINSSLGYTTFDDTTQNHTYLDMNGKTTPISIGAGIACKKGIIVVNSAGNSGNSNWQYIGAPADNYDVLTVGAVDENAEIAAFSSYGPNSEGSLKPNIVAQGKNTVIVNSDNQIITGNGTSFAAPINAGMIACLWGANIAESAFNIKDAIYKSADRYLNPDMQYGYGIPDYYEALKLLSGDLDLLENGDVFNFTSNSEKKVAFEIYCSDGRVVSKGTFSSPFLWQDIMPKSAGIYIVSFHSEGYEFVKKYIVSE